MEFKNCMSHFYKDRFDLQRMEKSKEKYTALKFFFVEY